MSFTLGVYDLFTYAIPGATYLTLISYVITRLHWLNVTNMLHANTTVVVIGAALASYLVGHVSYDLGRAASRIPRGWRKDMTYARKVFMQRVPSARDRPFLQGDRGALQAAVEARGMESSLEIVRLRAVGLMLRNVAPAFALGAIIAAAEAITGDSPIFATIGSVLLLLAAASSLWNSARLSHWADMKTLDLAFWIPDIDKAFTTDHPYGPPRRGPREPRSPSRRRKSATPAPP